MRDLSVIIPGRNELFMKQTIENILANIEANTEVIAICDGYWPNPPIIDHPRVTVIHHTVPVGQRAATNEGARLSNAKFIMKLDAHSAVDKGFDVKLMQDCKYNWTIIPRMYNLHAFDWECKKCGKRTYQGMLLGELLGPQMANCEVCGDLTEHEMKIEWQIRKNKRTDFARFDTDLHFQYWYDYEKKPEVKAEGDIADVMCHVGAGWFMHRKRFKNLGMLDENHGSWGQMGVEISLKTWLSGGRQIVNKNTWFAHMFRTKGQVFGFPYSISGRDQENARKYSRNLWFNNKWDKAVRKFDWVIQKFQPPGFDLSMFKN